MKYHFHLFLFLFTLDEISFSFISILDEASFSAKSSNFLSCSLSFNKIAPICIEFLISSFTDFYFSIIPMHI